MLQQPCCLRQSSLRFADLSIFEGQMKENRREFPQGNFGVERVMLAVSSIGCRGLVTSAERIGFWEWASFT